MTSTFRYSRSILIAAPAATILPAIADLNRHSTWSPFAKPDPKTADQIEGAAGVGQTRTFSGGRSGAGRITVDAVEPARVSMTLAMTKPVRATNIVEYSLVPDAGGTRVSWTMSGPITLLARLMGLFVDCDAMCGRMFEQGLAALKAEIEHAPELRHAA